MSEKEQSINMKREAHATHIMGAQRPAGGMCCRWHKKSYLADAAVGGNYNDGSKSRLKSAIQESEAFDVQHGHLINEQHPWHQFCHTLINVAVDHLQRQGPHQAY